MITIEDFRHLAELKRWSASSRAETERMIDSAPAALRPLMRKLFVAAAFGAALATYDNVDWLIALVERETGVQCEDKSIDALEVLQRVQASQARTKARREQL